MTRQLCTSASALFVSAIAALVSGCNSTSALPNADLVITAPALVTAGTTGLAASIPTQSTDYALAWFVDGGTITSDGGTSSITFTAGSGPTLDLSVTASAGTSVFSASAQVLVAPVPATPTIDAPAAAAPGAQGLVARVDQPQAGISYAWSITGGALAGSAGDAVQFSIPGNATASQSAILNCVASNAAGANATAATFKVSILAPAPAASALKLTFPATVVSGSANALTVAAIDGSGNAVTTYAGTVTFSSTDPLAHLPLPYTFVAGDAGQHLFSGVVLNSAGNEAISAIDNSATPLTATAGSIVTPGPPNGLKLSGVPLAVNAGDTNTLVVTIVDAAGNVATSYAGTLLISTNDPSASAVPAAGSTISTMVTAANAGVVTISPGIRLVTPAGNARISAADGSGLSGTLGPIFVGAAPTGLLLTGPSTAVAGNPVAYKVTAINAAGNPNTAYRGTISLYSTDHKAPAVLAQHQFNSTDAGVFTFSSVVFSSAQTTTLAATDGAAYASLMVTVSPGSASSIVGTGFPTQTVSGQPGNLTVTAFDSSGNIATGYSGTVAITTTNPQATLPANATFSSQDAGVHVFGGIVLKTASASSTYSITAADVAAFNLSSTESGIAVFPGQAASLSLSGVPSAVTAGDSNTLVVHLFDAAGNPATTYAGTLSVTTSDMSSQAVPAGNTSLSIPVTAASSGVVVVSPQIRLVTPAQAQVNVSEAVLHLSASISPISVASGGEQALHLTGPTVAQAGDSLSYTVSVVDSVGNVDSGYTGTISLYSSDPTLPSLGTYTFAAGDMGTHLFSNNVFEKAQTTQLTATDGRYSNLLNVVVSPGPVTDFVFGGNLPAPGSLIPIYSYSYLYITTGNPLGYTFTLTARDQYKNTATNYTGTVHFSSNDASGVLPPDTSFAGANGVLSGVGNAGLPFALYESAYSSIVATDLTPPPPMKTAATGIVYIATCPWPYASSFYVMDTVFSGYEPSAVVDNIQPFVGYTWSGSGGATVSNGDLQNGSYPLSVLYQGNGMLTAFGTNYAGDTGPSGSISVTTPTPLTSGMMLLAGTPGGYGDYQASGAASRLGSPQLIASDGTPSGLFYFGFENQNQTVSGHPSNYFHLTSSGTIQPVLTAGSASPPCSSGLVAASATSFLCLSSTYSNPNTTLALMQGTSGSPWTFSTKYTFPAGNTLGYPYYNYLKTLSQAADGTIFVADNTHSSIQILSNTFALQGSIPTPIPPLEVSAVDANTVYALLYDSVENQSSIVLLTFAAGIWTSYGPLIDPKAFPFPNFIAGADANTAYFGWSSWLFRLTHGASAWSPQAILDGDGFRDAQIVLPKSSPPSLLVVSGDSLQKLTPPAGVGSYQPQIIAGDIEHFTSYQDSIGLAAPAYTNGAYGLAGEEDVFNNDNGTVTDLVVASGELAAPNNILFYANSNSGGLAVLDVHDAVVGDLQSEANPDGGVNLFTSCSIDVYAELNGSWNNSYNIPFPDCAQHSPGDYLSLATADSTHVLAAFSGSIYLFDLSNPPAAPSTLFANADSTGSGFYSIQQLDAAHYVLTDGSQFPWVLNNPLTAPALVNSTVSGTFPSIDYNLLAPIGGTASFYVASATTFSDNLDIYRLDPLDINGKPATGSTAIHQWESTQVIARSRTGYVFKPGDAMTYQVNQLGQVMLLPTDNLLPAGTREMLLFDSQELTLGLLRFVDSGP